MKALLGVVALLGIGGAAEALAQSSRADVHYCDALAQKYKSYVGTSQVSPSQPADTRNDPEARLALSRCTEADARSAIPVLEARLRDARVELPQR